jgi:hypothetical protein
VLKILITAFKIMVQLGCINIPEYHASSLLQGSVAIFLQLLKILITAFKIMVQLGCINIPEYHASSLLQGSVAIFLQYSDTRLLVLRMSQNLLRGRHTRRQARDERGAGQNPSECC